jgi:putative glutamine amidotransferase
MRPRIAIPVPHSKKPDYNQRSLPPYENALRACGAEPVEIPLDASPEQIAKLINDCQAVLLPGSPADLDPQKFGQARDPKTNDPDPLRDNVDELLLQDAYNMHKPVFGICYGLQSLNVWRSGTLLQHIEGTAVNHQAGKTVPVAHVVAIEPASRFAAIVATAQTSGEPVPVNSSHHQSAQVVGDGLRVVARCAEDNIVEAIEGTSPEHFVLGVQWHPERSFESDAVSKALFQHFVEQARKYKPRLIEASV